MAMRNTLSDALLSQNLLKYKIPGGKVYTGVKQVLKKYGLHTICIEASCPNLGECLGKGRAAFLILGNICTRNCKYCSVEKGRPLPLDEEEPRKIAGAVLDMKLMYAVITSVSRDDLPDKGLSGFTKTLDAVRIAAPKCRVETLVPDFAGCTDAAIKAFSDRKPFVFNHNIEAAKSVYRNVRPLGSYELSLKLLKGAADAGNRVKSGLMVGLGETAADTERTMEDLRRAGVSILTIGQYFRSHINGVPVKKFWQPEEFEAIKAKAIAMGFTHTEAGANVRSSYQPENLFL